MPAPARSKPPQEFSLVSFIRSHLRDAELLPDEGKHELAAVAAAGEQFAKSSGALIRGHVLPLDRAAAGGLNTSTLAGGGAMVASGGVTLAAALRPVLQVERLGARRVQGQSGDRVVSAPAAVNAHWVGEDESVTAETAMFGAATLLPRDAAVRLRMSRSLFRQAGAIAEQELRAILQRSIGEHIEKGILAGSGANNEPLGLVNDAALQRRSYSAAASGQLPQAGRAAELVAELMENGADIDSVAVLASSTDYKDSQNLIAATGDAPLVSISDGRRRIAGVPISFSPYLPTGVCILADWSRLVISYVGEPQLIIDPFTNSNQGIINLTLFQSVSYAVERRELLTVATLAA